MGPVPSKPQKRRGFVHVTPLPSNVNCYDSELDQHKECYSSSEVPPRDRPWASPVEPKRTIPKTRVHSLNDVRSVAFRPNYVTAGNGLSTHDTSILSDSDHLRTDGTFAFSASHKANAVLPQGCALGKEQPKTLPIIESSRKLPNGPAAAKDALLQFDLEGDHDYQGTNHQTLQCFCELNGGHILEGAGRICPLASGTSFLCGGSLPRCSCSLESPPSCPASSVEQCESRGRFAGALDADFLGEQYAPDTDSAENHCGNDSSLQLEDFSALQRDLWVMRNARRDISSGLSDEMNDLYKDGKSLRPSPASVVR